MGGRQSKQRAWDILKIRARGPCWGEGLGPSLNFGLPLAVEPCSIDRIGWAASKGSGAAEVVDPPDWRVRPRAQLLALSSWCCGGKT